MKIRIYPIFSVLLAPLFKANANPIPDHPMTVESFSYVGSGCPVGTVTETVSSDGTSLDFTFTEFITEVGLGIPAFHARKNCQLGFSISIAPGWQVAFPQIDIDGVGFLDEGMSTLVMAGYYFQGQSQAQRFSTTVTGFFDEEITINFHSPDGEELWSPCGFKGGLSISFTTFVSNTDKQNFPEAEGHFSIDPDLASFFKHAVWSQCPS